MDFQALASLIYGTLGTIAFTMLTAESQLFRPFRQWCYYNGGQRIPWWRRCPTWIADLVQCPFCTSWWHAPWCTAAACWILHLDTRLILCFPAVVGLCAIVSKYAAKVTSPSRGDGSVQSALKHLDD